MNSKNLQTVLDILKDEVDGDVSAALQKLTDDYSMTWVEKGKKELFPSSGKNDDVFEEEMDEIYLIKGRKYDIRNIAEGENLVIIEMIESYPDPETGKVYRTPQVIVLEMEEGKIRKGRHYTDPRLSFMDLTTEQIEKDALKGTKSKIIID